MLRISRAAHQQYQLVTCSWLSSCRRPLSSVPSGGMMLGANPCNFGIIENHWKVDTARYPNGDSYIAQVKAAGYGATDLGDVGYLTGAQLEQSGLAVAGAFVEVSLSTADGVPSEDLKAFVEASKTLVQFMEAQGGRKSPFSPYIVLADKGDCEIRQRNSGSITADLEMTLHERRSFVQNLGTLRQMLSDEFDGLPMHFHPHCGSRVETLSEIDWLIDAADWLPLVFDTGHLYYATAGEADLMKLVDAWGAHIGSFHFKDLDKDTMHQAQADGLTYLQAVKAGMVVPLGEGAMGALGALGPSDFAGLMQWMRTNAFTGFICLEQETFEPELAGAHAEHNMWYMGGI